MKAGKVIPWCFMPNLVLIWRGFFLCSLFLAMGSADLEKIFA